MKKNFVSSHLNSSNHKTQENRKTRSLQLEALENRHLLSATSIMQTAIANDTDACKEVNQNTFTVQSNLSSDCADKIVAVYIQGNSDATFRLKDGDSAMILSQVRDSENEQISCLLVKMGAKSSFTLTTDTQLDGPMTVFVTHPLDLNGDGQGTEQEYYQVQGSYLNSLGQNQRIAAMFYKQHGIDLNTVELPKIFDLNNDGKISQDEWQLAANIQDSNYQLSPTITTTPQIENLQVGGISGTAVPNSENRFISNEDPSTFEDPAVTFALPDSENLPVKVVINYVDSEGNERTLTEEDVTVQGNNVSIPLEGGIHANSTVTVTFSYNGLEESETTYTYVFDSLAPALDVASQLTSDYNIYEGMVYTNDPTPEFQISPSGEIDWDAVSEEVANPDMGIWLVVKDDQTEVYRKKLTNSDLTKLQNDEFFVTLPRLANGCHSLSFYTEDLAGNQTTGSKEVLTIDTVKPVVAAEGHNVNYGTDSMYVETSTTPLEITVTDENLMITNPDGCVTMTSNRGDSAEPMETGVTDSSIQYAYSLDQSYGTNIWTFTVVDAAGNQSVKTFTYDYNKPPQVTNKGTKLQDADVRLTTDSTTASDYESQQAVGTVTDGELNLGKVADLFKEVDGSSIVADNVNIENLGDAVTSWEINDEGEIVLTLASFTDGETATFVSEGIVITYTDEYDKSADISFDLKWTNDTEAPVAALDANDALVDKAENEYYYTGEDDLALTFTFTDFNTVESGTIYVYGDDPENPIATSEMVDFDQAEVLLENPAHNQAYTFRYDAKDNFGNEVEGAFLCTIFVDQKVDVEDAEFALSGVNERDTDSTPSFEATFDALTEPATLVLYCDGTEVASVEVAADAESAEITSSELPEDGIYTFTAKLVDAAGNEFTVTPEDGLVYYFDTTAPTVAITNEAEDPTGVTNSDYTLTLDTQDAVSGVASILITQSYTDEGGNAQTKTYSSNETFDSCDVTLFYGVNTFTYTATDAAGNTSDPSAEFSVVFNTAPTAQGAFYNANEQKFVQTLSKSLCDENEQIKLDLTKYFNDEVVATLTGDGFTITGNSDQDAAVSACAIEEGFLVFTMTPGMEQGEPDRFSNVSFTLVDEFGKELAVSFDVTYLFDSFAPTIQLDDLTVTASEDGNVTKNTDTLYFLTGDEFHIEATITDDTGIETCGWSLSKIVGEETTVVASGETANVSYTETGVEDGAKFVLTAWGKDTLVPANESTAEEPSCTYQFYVDNTAPTATLVSSQLQTSDDKIAPNQSLTNDNHPRIAYTIVVNDLVPDCCKLSIFHNGELIGDYFDFMGKIIDDDTALEDGVHRYTFQVEDGAGNKSDVYSIIEFVVDTTAPVWTVTEVANAPAEEGDYGFLFLDENDSVEFNLEVEDNISALEDVAFQYSTDGGETWTDYVPGDGVALEFGTKTFLFKAIDEAGNESISETTIDVSYDHTPTVTRTTLEAKEPIGFVENQTEYTVQFTDEEVSALFDDADIENGDALTITCNFEGADGVVTASDWTFNNGVWNLKLTVDPAALKQSHTFGTLTSLTATDTFDQSAVKELNMAIDKVNLAPEQTETATLTDTQKLEETPSYTFDLTNYFADPEGDEWTISAAEINGDECAIDGKSITWTPSEGLYGRTSLEITV
ncbi:MAG: Ig-like domain repeat protein, partial [Thermoguttaceae bacterium]|nr:Ig-like domain repeat protein [Thermoguttaceae bacterium]